MVHYRQGTFHCYILSCVVSGDKRTTILISIRRKNTWLEPMKSAFSFCHWLRPSGPNKVFPFESTAVGNYTATLLLNICLFFLSLHFFENQTCFFHGFNLVPDLISAHVKQNKIKYDFINAPVSSHSLFLSLSLSMNVFPFVQFSLLPYPFFGSDRRADHVSQSVSGWQFYNTCTTVTGTITHKPIALHSETKRQESEGVGEGWSSGSKDSWVKIMVVWLRETQ